MIAGGVEMNREMQRVEAAIVQRCGVRAAGQRWCGGGVCFIASLIAGYTAGWGGSRLLVVLGRKLKGGSRVGSAVVRRPSRKMIHIRLVRVNKALLCDGARRPGRRGGAGVGVIGARGTI